MRNKQTSTSIKEHQTKLYKNNATMGENNGKLLPRTCPGCSVPQPYRSHDWALVPANPAFKAEY